MSEEGRRGGRVGGKGRRGWVGEEKGRGNEGSAGEKGVVGEEGEDKEWKRLEGQRVVPGETVWG